MSHNNASTFTMGGRIIETGGETAFGQPINNVRAYDPATDQWVELTPLPANKSAAVAGAINGVIHILQRDREHHPRHVSRHPGFRSPLTDHVTFHPVNERGTRRSAT